MRLAIPTALAVVIAAFGCSCSVGGGARFSSHLDSAATHVRERTVLPDPGAANIVDLALSVPTYVSTEIERHLKDHVTRTNYRGDAWYLQGDGGQCPVIVRRWTSPGQNPVVLQVVQGATPPEDPGYVTVYKLEKMTGGWKVLSAEKGTYAEFVDWPASGSWQ